MDILILWTAIIYTVGFLLAVIPTFVMTEIYRSECGVCRASRGKTHKILTYDPTGVHTYKEWGTHV